MPPIHITDEGVLDKGKAECLGEGEREIALIYFGRKNGDGCRSRREILRVGRKFKDNGRGGDHHSENEYERVFPVLRKEISIGDDAAECREDEDEGRDTEGDVGVEPETEDETAYKERDEAFGAETAEEKIEREREKEWHHDGAETDSGKVDRPVGKSDKKGGEEGNAALVPEFFCEKIDAEHGECSEERREKFECGDIRAKEKNGKCLKIDEESFATVIVGIEESIVARFIGKERVDAVHCLVRVEPGGDVFDIPEPEEKRRREKNDQDGCCYEFFI